MDSEKCSFRIVMFPWLAHGHIFPYLELAKRILNNTKNLQFYLCSTPINFTSINNFIHNNSLDNFIEIIPLHLDPNPELPPHYHTTKNLPSDLIFTLIKSFQTAKSSFSDILTTLRPDLVIFDVFQPWAAQLASSLGIPAVNFVIIGAATRSLSHHLYTCWNDEFPFPELLLHENDRKTLDTLMEFVYTNVFEQDKDMFFVNFKLSSEFVLVKTSMALEGKYVDYVSAVCNKKILTVGPLVTDKNEEDDDSDILQWLSTKEAHSTVYISFGSECFLSKGEIEELAKGLELCQVNFIWVVRFPVTEKAFTIEEAFPEGFLERVKERGRVVLGWAAQANILGHPSTGAFVSHCGWSSLNESVYYGVPVIGMPIRLNMFIDAKMLVHAGACVEVLRDENGVYKGEVIAKAISMVMVESNGEGLRLRAKELSEKMRMEDKQAIEETTECLWQLCCKNKGKDY